MESGARFFWKGIAVGVLTHDEKRFYCQTSFYTSRYCHVVRCKTMTTKHWSISLWCWKRTNFLIVKVCQNDASVPMKFPDSILYDQCGVLKSPRRVFRHQASDKYFSRSYLRFRHFYYKTSSSLINTGRDGHESENLLQISNLIVLKNERSLKEKDVKPFKRISHQLELIHLHILLQAIFLPLPHPKLFRLLTSSLGHEYYPCVKRIIQAFKIPHEGINDMTRTYKQVRCFLPSTVLDPRTWLPTSTIQNDSCY